MRAKNSSTLLTAFVEIWCIEDRLQSSGLQQVGSLWCNLNFQVDTDILISVFVTDVVIDFPFLR